MSDSARNIEDYVDYTMWIETENAGWFFNGEWENEEPQEQVIKEWNELLEEAKADDLDKLLGAELRKHSDYTEDEDGGITAHEMIVIRSWESEDNE